MKTLTDNELVTVAGGKSDAITQQLTSLKSSIDDLASSRSSSGTDNTMTMMMMALALRPQPQAAVVATAAAPIVKICARWRR